jgi:hypothetical protein
MDSLVTMETPLRNVDRAVEIRKAVDFPFPADLLVRTPQQIGEALYAFTAGTGFTVGRPALPD